MAWTPFNRIDMRDKEEQDQEIDRGREYIGTIHNHHNHHHNQQHHLHFESPLRGSHSISYSSEVASNNNNNNTQSSINLHSSPISSPLSKSTMNLKAKPQPKQRIQRISHLEPGNTPTFPINYPIYPSPNISTVPIQQVPLMPLPGSIVMKRYATSVDQRNFLTVYEYMVNNQWVIWDYFTGYVHLTGLWKAVGNSKADIVRLIDNSPDLEPVIRRVRGGFLKIQGTWLPYDVAKTLASRTCYHIRYALIAIFGPDFPDSCLQPHEPGFGQLQLNTTENRRKRKRSSVSLSGINIMSSPGPLVSRKRRQSELTPPASKILEYGMSGNLNYVNDNRNSSNDSNSNNSNISNDNNNNNNNSNLKNFATVTPLSPIYKPLSNSPSTSSSLPIRHRHSKSIGSIDMSNLSIGQTIVPRLELHKPSLFKIPNHDQSNAIESSSEDEDDDDYEAHLVKRAKHTHPRYILPPPMPLKVVFADETELIDRPDEFLAVLQATRSLQQLSAGKAGRRWSINNTTSNNDCGGSFECGGKLWRWDGGKNLTSSEPAAHKLIQQSILPERRYSHGDEPIPDRSSIMKINGLIS